VPVCSVLQLCSNTPSDSTTKSLHAGCRPGEGSVSLSLLLRSLIECRLLSAPIACPSTAAAVRRCPFFVLSDADLRAPCPTHGAVPAPDQPGKSCAGGDGTGRRPATARTSAPSAVDRIARRRRRWRDGKGKGKGREAARADGRANGRCAAAAAATTNATTSRGEIRRHCCDGGLRHHGVNILRSTRLHARPSVCPSVRRSPVLSRRLPISLQSHAPGPPPPHAVRRSLPRAGKIAIPLVSGGGGGSTFGENTGRPICSIHGRRGTLRLDGGRPSDTRPRAAHHRRAGLQWHGMAT